MELALKYCVDAILIGNYLTTIGIDPKDDIETVKKVGKKIIKNNVQ